MRFPWNAWLERRVSAEIERVRPEIIEQSKPEIIREFSAEVARAMAGQSNMNGTAGMAQVPYSYPQTSNSPFPLYGMDRPIWFNTPNTPRKRPDSLLTIDTIRQFADNYDIARSCINHLKREVMARKFTISPRDAKDDSDATRLRIEEAKQFFTKKGGLGEQHETRRIYEAKILEDVLVIGAFAAWKNKTKGGRLMQSIAIDAATIRPRMDAYGWPGPGDDWYEQWIMGMKVTGFKPDELTYDGLWPMTHTPWFRSPIEYLISTVMSALKADEWNRTWLTDGNTPSDMLAAPESWTPEQIIQYAEFFEAMLSGNTQNRQKTKWVPSGTSRVSSNGRKDQDFAEFELWLARRTGAIFGVQLASIGFAGEQYKVSQEGSLNQTTQFGAGQCVDLLKEHYDDILEDLGYEDLEIVNGSDEEEDAKTRAERLLVATGGVPWVKINEARKEDGLDPIDEGDVILVSNKLQPLDRALEEPEPQPAAATTPPEDGSEEDDLQRWARKCINRLKQGETALCGFVSEAISDVKQAEIREMLAGATSKADVKRIFEAYL